MKLVLLILCQTFILCQSQPPFSPFEFLGNLFKPSHSWTSSRQAKKLRSSGTRTAKPFRPHLPISPSFSASQVVPTVIRFSGKHSAGSPKTSGKSGNYQNYPVIKLSPPSTLSRPTAPPIYIKSITTTETANETPIVITSNRHISSSTSKLKASDPNGVKTSLLKPSNVTPDVVTDEDNFNTYSTSHDSEVSGPNPDDFPIISLIDEPSLNYYQQVIQNSPGKRENVQKTPNPYIASSNPYYAPEEFTYNQDPILIDHDDTNEDVIKENTAVDDDDKSKSVDTVTQSISGEYAKNELIKIKEEENINEVEDLEETQPTTVKSKTTFSTIFLDQPESRQPKENVLRSLRFKTITSGKIFRKSNELTNLVNTIEYEPKNIQINIKKSINSEKIKDIGSLVDCGSSSDLGVCSMTSSYPKEMIESLIQPCSDIIEAFKAFVPEDFDALGDNSIHVINSEKDLSRPWSWKVYAYKKQQVCESELSFTRPSYGQDTKGNWNVILQTDKIVQRVSLDICQYPGYPCTGVSGCSRRSSCVQRYTHQFLLSLPKSLPEATVCPSIRTFRFPSGCVCHTETDFESDLEKEVSEK